MDNLNEPNEESKSDFLTLIQSIESDLYNIAKSKFSDTNDINDVIQETIIKIYENLDDLKHINCFRTWAIKILLNECKKIYKMKNKQLMIFKKIINKEGFYQEDYSINKLENDLCFKELLNVLSPLEQNLFIFYYQCKYSIKEISLILNINENTVKSKLKRSKTKIREKYMEGGLM